MNHDQQHRVQTMHLYYNPAKKYKKPIPPETGARLKYDIKELRLRPEKLTEEYQEQEQDKKTKTLQDARRGWGEWEDYQKTLGGGYFEKHIHSEKGDHGEGTGMDTETRRMGNTQGNIGYWLCT